MGSVVSSVLSIFDDDDDDPDAPDAVVEEEKLAQDEVMVQQMRASSNVIRSPEFFAMMKKNGYSDRVSHIAAYILARNVNCKEEYYILRRGLSILGVQFLRTLTKIIDQGTPDLSKQDRFFNWRREDFTKIEINKKDLIDSTNEYGIFLHDSEYEHYAIVIVNDKPIQNKCDIEQISEDELIVGIFNIRPFVQIQESLNEMRKSDSIFNLTKPSRRGRGNECIILKNKISQTEWNNKNDALGIPTFCQENAFRLFLDFFKFRKTRRMGLSIILAVTIPFIVFIASLNINNCWSLSKCYTCGDGWPNQFNASNGSPSPMFLAFWCPMGTFVLLVLLQFFTLDRGIFKVEVRYTLQNSHKPYDTYEDYESTGIGFIGNTIHMNGHPIHEYLSDEVENGTHVPQKDQALSANDVAALGNQHYFKASKITIQNLATEQTIEISNPTRGEDFDAFEDRNTWKTDFEDCGWIKCDKLSDWFYYPRTPFTLSAAQIGEELIGFGVSPTEMTRPQSSYKQKKHQNTTYQNETKINDNGADNEANTEGILSWYNKQYLKIYGTIKSQRFNLGYIHKTVLFVPYYICTFFMEKDKEEVEEICDPVFKNAIETSECLLGYSLTSGGLSGTGLISTWIFSFIFNIMNGITHIHAGYVDIPVNARDTRPKWKKMQDDNNNDGKHEAEIQFLLQQPEDEEKKKDEEKRKGRKKINWGANWQNTPIEGVEWTVLNRAIPLKHPFYPTGYLSIASEILSYTIGYLYIGLCVVVCISTFWTVVIGCVLFASELAAIWILFVFDRCKRVCK